MTFGLSRRSFLKTLAGSALASIGLGGYALGVEPGFRLRIQHYAVTPRGWPPDLSLRIAALADIHVGEPHMSLARVERIAAATNGLGADLIVLLGDYAAGHSFVTKPITMWEFARVAAALKAPLGVYAVLGNHDWWDDRTAQRLRTGPVIAAREIAAVGIPVLENDAVRLVKHGRPFWLLGLGDQLAFWPKSRPFGVDDLPATLAQLTDDAPAILLAHEPDIFPNVPSRVALTLSGHTHGGQVRMLGWSPVVPSRYRNRYAYGHVVEDGRDLIVSGGLGTSIAPVRFGVPPEIVLIDLWAAPKSV